MHDGKHSSYQSLRTSEQTCTLKELVGIRDSVKTGDGRDIARSQESNGSREGGEEGREGKRVQCHIERNAHIACKEHSGEKKEGSASLNFVVTAL